MACKTPGQVFYFFSPEKVKRHEEGRPEEQDIERHHIQVAIERTFQGTQKAQFSFQEEDCLLVLVIKMLSVSAEVSFTCPHLLVSWVNPDHVVQWVMDIF